MKNEMSEAADVRIGMSAILKVAGFDRMAQDVLTEKNGEVLMKYAKVILKNTSGEIHDRAYAALKAARLAF